MMSFWTPKKKIRIILWIIQIILIFVISWIISTDWLWSAGNEYEKISQDYFVSQITNLSSEKFLSNSSAYAISSIDQMINSLGEMQFLLSSFSWLEKEKFERIDSLINDEIEYLSIRREELSQMMNEEEIKVAFLPVYENWQSFRYQLNIISRDLFSSSILINCEGISSIEDLTVVDSEIELEKYTEFTMACEDWAVENCDLSEFMIEWIKVVE